MGALLAAQAVAIALLGVLVLGLLRSHAAILRSLHRMGAGLEPAGPAQAGVTTPVLLGSRPLAPAATASAALDLAGTDPAGRPVRVRVRDGGQDTLLAFLSSTCFTCAGFWRDFAAPGAELGLPAGTRLVIVTKDEPHENARRVRELAPRHHTVVASTEAWDGYGVPTSPYFLHVEGATGRILGQGAGGSWAQVRSLLLQSIGDSTARTR